MTIGTTNQPNRGQRQPRADGERTRGAILRAAAAIALEQHELPAREDPERLAFELHSILLGADTKFVLHDDPAVLDLARQVIRQRLGLDHGSHAGQS